MAKRYKLTKVQTSAIPKMKAVGLTYREISKTLHVSIGTVQYYLNTQNGVKVKKRGNPGRCELCGKEFKVNGRSGEFSPGSCSYHHWDYTKLGMGIWICCRCHRLVELVELILEQDSNVISIIAKYLNLKEHLSRRRCKNIDDLEIIIQSIHSSREQ